MKNKTKQTRTQSPKHNVIQFHTRVFGLKYSDVSMVQATLPQEDYGLVKVE